MLVLAVSTFLGVSDLQGVKISVFRLTLLVIVTTMLPQVIAKIKKNCSKLTKRQCT